MFGDVADRSWTVAQQVEDRRAYHVFEELNTFTAVVYLKKVNHPAGDAGRGVGGATMATVTSSPTRPAGGPRPNIPSAGNRFPAIRDYEQVDRDIIGTLRPTLGWFAALGVAILCLLIGIARGRTRSTRASARRAITRR